MRRLMRSSQTLTILKPYKIKFKLFKITVQFRFVGQVSIKVILVRCARAENLKSKVICLFERERLTIDIRRELNHWK